MQTGVFVEERRALSQRLGFQAGGWLRGLGVHVAIIAIFGVAIPWVKGLDFFDPLILTAYACLGAVFAAPAVAHGFAGRTAARVDARIALSVFYGEAVALGALAVGIATVWWTHRNRLFFPPDPALLGAAAGFGFVLSFALATAAAGLTVTRSPAAARAVLRGILLGLLVLFWLRGRLLFDHFGASALVALVFGLGFRFALRAALARCPEGGPQ
jgi:hypothetical protein